MALNLMVKITSNLEEFNKLIERANDEAKKLKETLKEINDFNLEIGTKQV